ncbi:MAG: CBS domain-containing protein [Phycisphaerae bacterium]|nr:CBS domain-containing protein [Phycisphaerae bacterium]NIP52828.1 CBS domain-containing protein [Phycisphaerae bacterium]NIS51849.1 CBS domain-containing protein [Phycisphaerae bacterium]NIU09367.1 CBS domain-containing protein [Phycisphaerae bacterium]NIU57600.1 CBS domain-containing protein [Phycisphaerae bacterium]
MDPLLSIGIMVVAGFLGGLALEKLRLPKISGYIIVGALLSPSLLEIIPEETVESLDIITKIALGIIAYLIGGSLKAESLRHLRKSIAWVIIFQSIGACLLVTVVLALTGHLVIPGETFWQYYLPMAFIIGAVSCATAPAATMAIVSEYKAKGPLSTTLLAVVALDDAIAVIAFAIATGISEPLANGTDGISIYQTLGVPLLHIVASIAVGAVFAVALIYISRLAKARELLLAVVFGIVMLCAGISSYLGLSSILANMVMGFILVNKVRRTEVFGVLQDVEAALYAVFFVLAGLHFDFHVLKATGILAMLIVLARCLGKYAGTWIGAKISGAPDTVRKYLGFALLPKAGVTIGLILLASMKFPGFGDVMLSAVLASTIINELIAPPLVKYAISKAGEVGLNITEDDLIKTYKVADVMDTEPTIIPQELLLQEILEVFSKSDSMCYPVVNGQSQLIGIITIPGIKEMFANREFAGWLLACDVAEPVRDKTNPNKSLEEAMEWMRRYHLENIPVVASDESDELVGVLDYRKTLRKISAEVLHRRKTAEEMALVKSQP